MKTVMCLKAVICQADNVIKAVNLDGKDTLVIRVGMFFNVPYTYVLIFLNNLHYIHYKWIERFKRRCVTNRLFYFVNLVHLQYTCSKINQSITRTKGSSELYWSPVIRHPSVRCKLFTFQMSSLNPPGHVQPNFIQIILMESRFWIFKRAKPVLKGVTYKIVNIGCMY